MDAQTPAERRADLLAGLAALAAEEAEDELHDGPELRRRYDGEL